MNPQINAIDFNERPFIAIWEVTQACYLACVHCRASTQPDRNPMELSTDEGKHLIDQIAAMRVPVFVLTGGDPIKRPDRFELIAHTRSVGVRVTEEEHDAIQAALHYFRVGGKGHMADEEESLFPRLRASCIGRRACLCRQADVAPVATLGGVLTREAAAAPKHPLPQWGRC